MQSGGSLAFEFRGVEYLLGLTALENSLLGVDHGRFMIARPGGPSEKEKIERLIAGIEGMVGAVFIRNGGEHTAADAADHLRSKWKVAGDKISTARTFIAEIGTKSSLSGDPYQIRMADGSVVECCDYLRQRLIEIESGG
jgi:hypothetical protein